MSAEIQDMPQTPGAGESQYAVEMRHIRKEWPGVVANDDVSLSVLKGEIHAMVGENGPGKSTLTTSWRASAQQRRDFHQRSASRPEVRAIPSPLASAWHQHFTPIPPLTVGENIAGPRANQQRRFRDTAKANAAIRDLSRWAEMDPTRTGRDLPVGLQQRAETLKVLIVARISHPDEPRRARRRRPTISSRCCAA
jgi:simple sugar transport system ATP-binding protein